jgi:hypothetical protein
MKKLIELCSLDHREHLSISYDDSLHFGANQHWFEKDIQINGGCGPICAYNAINYIEKTQDIKPILHKQVNENLDYVYGLIHPMEILKVIPTKLRKNKSIPLTLGVPNLRRFSNKFIRGFKNDPIKFGITKYVLNRKGRDIHKVIDFIKNELENEHPVCFLNTFTKSTLFIDPIVDLKTSLNINAVQYEEELMSFRKYTFMTHWVLITGVYQTEDTDSYYVECSSWGQICYFRLNDFIEKQKCLSRIYPSGMLSIRIVSN